mmetsp:Transcript_39673/g.45166  ORF Transcript_39673/g.45166 Transcript_39673/m.45166 type:complete len:521 (+) Transcript_39673:65-1627(+)
MNSKGENFPEYYTLKIRGLLKFQIGFLLWFLACYLSLAADKFKIGKVQASDEWYIFTMFSFDLPDDKTQTYADLQKDGSDPFNKVAGISKNVGLLMLVIWFVTICLMIWQIKLKLKPFVWRQMYVETCFWALYGSFSLCQFVLLDNMATLKAWIDPSNKEQEERILEGFYPLSSIAYGPAVGLYMYTQWKQISTKGEVERNQAAEEEEQRNQDQQMITNAENNPTLQVEQTKMQSHQKENSPRLSVATNPITCRFEPETKGNPGLPPLKIYPFVGDFQIDTSALYFLSLTKAYNKRFKSPVANALVRFGAIGVTLAQIFCLARLVLSITNVTDFDGNESRFSLRVLLVWVLFIQVYGDVMKSFSRFYMVVMLPLEVFQATGKKEFWLRISSSIMILMQILVSMLMFFFLPIVLLKLDDEEGSVGILAEFTSLIILIEMDDIVIGGILYMARMFDRRLSQSAIDATVDDFFNSIDTTETPEAKQFMHILIRSTGIFCIATLWGVIYPVYLYRFKEKAYLDL